MVRRRRRTLDADYTPALSSAMDAVRALSNLFAVLFFGGALSIVVMSFTRGV